MVYLQSTYITENEGYAGETLFNFNLDHFASSIIKNAKWIWGDGTLLDTKELNVSKIYSTPGTYNIVLKLSHIPPGVKREQQFEYKVTITVKKPFLKKFLIQTSAGPQNSTVYARATKINLIPFSDLFGSNGEKIKFIQWDLGNGIVTNRFSLEGVTYEQPGIYEITMLLYDLNNVETVSKQLITVEEYLNDSIKFVTVPPPTYAGHLNRYPFKIEITSTVPEETHVVDLYAQFSKSQPTLDYPTNYSFLRSQWRFLDKNLQIIKNLNITGKDVRINDKGELDNNGTLVGVRGSAEFYFIDDWYNYDQVVKQEQCTTLWATLRSDNIRSNKITDNLDGLQPGHANTTAQAWCPYVTLWRKPDNITISSNGISPIPQIQWAGSDIPLIIKVGYDSLTFPDAHNSEGQIKLIDNSGFAHYVPNNTKESALLDLSFSNMINPISSYLNPSEYPLRINYTDKDQFMVGGYYKTLFEKKDPGVVSLSATLSAYEPVLYGHHYNPFLWLSNATNAGVAVAQYIFTDNIIINSPQYFYSNEIDTYKQFFKKDRRKIATVKKNPNLNTALINDIFTPVKKKNYVSSIYDNKNKLSGLYATAALNFPTYHAWVSDVESDMIYRLTTDGKIYKSINLSEVLKQYNIPKFTPHSMVLDSNLNLFVALWDPGMVVKFNDEGVLLKVLILNNEKPVCIDVGVDDFIYVSCANKYVAFNEKGSLKKYSNDLNVLRANLYYTDKEPGNIIADATGGVYVIRGGHISNNKQTYNLSSNIEKIKWIDSDIDTSLPDLLPESGYIETTYGQYPAIKHICLDKNDSVFFTFGYNKVGKIISNTRSIITTTINPDTLNDTTNNSILDGLAYNINHKIYVINSIDNKVSALNPDDLSLESSFYANPSKIKYKTNEEGNLIYDSQLNWYVKEPSPNISSLRSNGDWTGWRWSYKFNHNYGTGMYTLSGKSKSIWLAEHEAYKFFTKTENFDMAKYMRNFSFMPVLKDSPFLYDNLYNNTEQAQGEVDAVYYTRDQINESIINLSITEEEENINENQIIKLKEELSALDQGANALRQPLLDRKGFFGSIFGTYPFESQDPGLMVYDKIANFVSNSGDPDVCDLKHLQEMMQKIKFEDNDFKFYFPNGLSRVVDYCSINPSRLMGVICNCGDIYNKNEYNTGSCSYCGREKLSNKGEQIFTNNYTVTAGIPVILKNKNTLKYRKVNTGILSDQNMYSLFVLASSIGLSEYWPKLYEFYEYKSNSSLILNLSASNYRTENIIDWSNQQTTLPKNQNIQQWYQDEGLIDRMINFELQKGLGLI